MTRTGTGYESKLRAMSRMRKLREGSWKLFVKFYMYKSMILFGINVRTVRSNHIVLYGSKRFKHDSSNSTLGKNILATFKLILIF